MNIKIGEVVKYRGEYSTNMEDDICYGTVTRIDFSMGKLWYFLKSESELNSDHEVMVSQEDILEMWARNPISVGDRVTFGNCYYFEGAGTVVYADTENSKLIIEIFACDDPDFPPSSYMEIDDSFIDTVNEELFILDNNLILTMLLE